MATPLTPLTTCPTSPEQSHPYAWEFLRDLYEGMEGWAGIFFRRDTKGKHADIVSMWLSVNQIRNISAENWRRVCYMNVEKHYHVEIKAATFQKQLAHNEQGKYADLLHTRIFSADIDVENGTAADMPRVLKTPLISPTWGVFSGGGYHLYWQLDNVLDMTTQDGIDYVKSYRLGIAHELKGDNSLQSPTHPLRMPFTYNQKEKKYGFNTVMCYTLREWREHNTYSIEAFKYHRVFKPRLATPVLSATEADVIVRRRGALVQAMYNRAANAPDGNRNKFLYEAAIAMGTLIVLPEDESEFRKLLENAAAISGLMEDDERSVRNTIDSGLKAGKTKGNHSVGRDTAWRRNYDRFRNK